jgi:hypothetical protein
MSRDFDFTQTSRPVNSTAANVLRPGEHYETKKKITVLHWDAPPKIKEFHGPENENHTGKKFGRLTVFGYYGKVKDMGMWIVRCSCGKYTIRRSKAIKNLKNDLDRCDFCRDLLERKNRDYYLRHGTDLPKGSSL